MVRVVVGMATMKGREGQCLMALNSLSEQTKRPDAIYVYDNAKLPNLTDNGKFYGLTLEPEPCIYLSCDDDLIYPPTYVADMVAAVEQFGGIVTHHGRKLRGKGLSYYTAHAWFSCLKEVAENVVLDVPGTGVSAWNTGEVGLRSIIKARPFKMTDVHVGLFAAQKGYTITLLKHKSGYIKQQSVKGGIYESERGKAKKQQELCDLILEIKSCGMNKAMSLKRKQG